MMSWAGPAQKPVLEIRSKEGVLHFRRWRLLETPWGSIYLHNITRADEDTHLHDHPWDFFSIILRGGYIEILRSPNGEVRATAMTPGRFAYRTTRSFHKIQRLLAPTWTLFFAGRHVHDGWGYWSDEEGFIEHGAYRERKHAGTLPRE